MAVTARASNTARTVPDRFLEVVQVTLREFFNAIVAGKDADPSWKKAIYKVICKLDSEVPEIFKSPNCTGLDSVKVFSEMHLKVFDDVRNATQRLSDASRRLPESSGRAVGLAASRLELSIKGFQQLPDLTGHPGFLVRKDVVLLAAGYSVGYANLSYASLKNRGVVVFLKDEHFVAELIVSSVSLNSIYRQVSLLVVPSTRVTISGVSPLIPNEVFEWELQRFRKLASIFRLRLVKHYMVYASTGSKKCFECGDVGHKQIACPQRQADGRREPGARPAEECTKTAAPTDEESADPLLRRGAAPHRLSPRQERDATGRRRVRPGNSKLFQTEKQRPRRHWQQD
eukprot:superscaffoldBa00002262_g13705